MFERGSIRLLVLEREMCRMQRECVGSSPDVPVTLTVPSLALPVPSQRDRFLSLRRSNASAYDVRRSGEGVLID